METNAIWACCGQFEDSCSDISRGGKNLPHDLEFIIEIGRFSLGQVSKRLKVVYNNFSPTF